MCAPSALGAPGPLAARAPGGGDSVPLISRCAKFKLPELVGRRVRAARARKLLLHLESFTLWAGGGAEETRPPRGPARRAGGRKGGGRFPPQGVVASPHLSGPWTRGRGGRTAHETDGHVQGRADESTSRVSWPFLPAGRARAAAGRARRCPAESRPGQRAGGKGRRERGWEGAEGARPARGRGVRLGPATGDPEALAARGAQSAL